MEVEALGEICEEKLGLIIWSQEKKRGNKS